MNVYRIYFSNGLSAFIRADSLTDALKVCVADMVVWWAPVDPLFRSCELPRRVDVAKHAPT